MSDELADLRERVEALEAKLEGRETIPHLQAERIDVIEQGGQLRLSATNRTRSPETTVDGVTFPGRSRPGLIFFNDTGDECGGLSFGNSSDGADSVLTWDRLNQDQVTALVYNEQAGRYRAGFGVYERSTTGLSELARRLEEIKNLTPDEQAVAHDELERMPGTGQPRVFVGRDHSGTALLVLLDAQGQPRIRLEVPDSGPPKISVLDETGAIEREF